MMINRILIIATTITLFGICIYGNAGTEEIDYNVGVHYYPWHFYDFHGRQYLREHLVPAQLPELGEYNDHDEAVINQHLKWSRNTNIDFWLASWWGPCSRENATLLYYILQNPNLGSLKIAIHYETRGRTNDFQDYSNLGPDITYLADDYFAHPNYLKINGKPVVIFYLTRELSSLGTLQSSLVTMRQAATNAGYQLYIMGDQAFGSPPASSGDIALLDAIVNHSVYGSMGATGYAGQANVDSYYAAQAEWKALADSAGTDYAPAVIPGFNDKGKGVIQGHDPLSRKLTQSDEFGSLFSAMLRGAKTLTDPDIDHMIIVNSWNHWHADTQIEPVKEAPPTSTDDSLSGTDYTNGLSYEGYGTLYLDILRKETFPSIQNISVLPTTHDFGNVAVGTSSEPLELTISNTGNADLEISGIGLSEITNYNLNENGGSTACGSTMPTISAGGSCTINVTFSPSSAGTLNATLTIDSDDPDTSSLGVSLTGSGVSVDTGDGSDSDGGGGGGGCFITTLFYNI